MFYTEVKNVFYTKVLIGDLTMPQNMQSCPLMPTVKPSFVIFDIQAGHQGAQMSKITNDGLTQFGTERFIAVPIWQQCVSKG